MQPFFVRAPTHWCHVDLATDSETLDCLLLPQDCYNADDSFLPPFVYRLLLIHASFSFPRVLRIAAIRLRWR